ncbi:TfoX/Sxy family protein [Xylophilus sp. GOD-11R]|uniref:TfoX/Sxy family protein n=1 Tax=Xylophilus sp. GOD-11R TaxID=3089814 RepID=UPI00298CFB6A|nr:TfoX/Sxy family protein [Xylophilus sp. GOD-11R]WPB57547.1 TfoX/Sxy family protein [Xylophilus sp. GOD-11R]
MRHFRRPRMRPGRVKNRWPCGYRLFMIGRMSALADDLPEVFERFGRITLRRMFGGHGVFHDGLMFGVVIDGRLYLKADAQSLPRFEARELGAFEYQRAGKTVTLSYREAPPEVFEDRSEAVDWARLAWEAAVRGASHPKAKAKVAKTAKTAKTAKAAKSAKAAAPRKRTRQPPGSARG